MKKITTDLAEIKRIKKSTMNNYVIKLYNLYEMDKLLETYNLPKLNCEKIKNLKRLIHNQ